MAREDHLQQKGKTSSNGPFYISLHFHVSCVDQSVRDYASKRNDKKTKQGLFWPCVLTWLMCEEPALIIFEKLSHENFGNLRVNPPSPYESWSLNKPLIRPYFLVGCNWGGTLRSPFEKRRCLFTWTQHPRISKALSPGPFGIASAAKEASGAVSVKKGKSCQSVWVIILTSHRAATDRTYPYALWRHNGNVDICKMGPYWIYMEVP